MRIALVLLTVAALSGCETMQQRSAANAPPDPTASCLSAPGFIQGLEPIANKVSLQSASGTSLPMLADQSRTSESEKSALDTWRQRRIACMASGREWRARNAPPRFAALQESFSEQVNSAISELYQGRLTFGEFNARRESLVSTSRPLFAEALERDRADVRANQDRRQAASDSAALGLQLMRPQQPPFAPPPMPINCTSQQFGSQVQTRCN